MLACATRLENNAYWAFCVVTVDILDVVGILVLVVLAVLLDYSTTDKLAGSPILHLRIISEIANRL